MNGDRLGRVVRRDSRLVQFVFERFHPNLPGPSPEVRSWLPFIVWTVPEPYLKNQGGCACPLYIIDEFSVLVLERRYSVQIDRCTIGICKCMGRFLE